METSYTGFDPRNDKVNKGTFYDPRYTILANIYGISRREIEQRDRKRQARRRNLIAVIASTVIIALSVALIYALLSRQEAVRQRLIAQQEQHEAEVARQGEETQRKNAEASAEDARKQRDEAIRQRNNARSVALGVRAQQEFSGGKGDLAIALAMEANKLQEPPEQARQALANVAYYAPGTRRLFRGHTDKVTSVAFSPDGRRVLSGSRDQKALLHDVSSGREVGRFAGQQAGVNSCAFSVDGKHAVLGYLDGTLILLDVADTGEMREIHRLRGHKDAVNSVAFSPDGQTALSGSSDKTMILWRLADAGPILRFGHHKKRVTSVAFNPNPTRSIVVSGSEDDSTDDSMCWWDSKTGKLRGCIAWEKQLHCPIYGVRSLAFNPNGDTLLVGFGMPELWFYNIDTRGFGRFARHEGSGLSVTFSQQGDRAISGSNDNSIIVWNSLAEYETDRVLQRFVGHEGPVNSVAFSPDGRTVVSGSDDTTVRLWGIASGAEKGQWTAGVEIVSGSDCFLCKPAPSRSSSPDGKMDIWRAVGGQEPSHRLDLRGELNRVITFSPDGKKALGNWHELPLRLWDLSTGKMLREFDEIHKFYVTSVAFSPDGRTAISSSYSGPGSRQAPPDELDRLIVLWDLGTGKAVRRLIGHSWTVWCVEFSPDGRTVLSASEDGTLALWDVNTGRQIRALTEHTAGVLTVAFSPDGKAVLSGCRDGTLLLWDAHTWHPIRRLVGHTGAVNSVAFLPHGKKALSGSEDRSIILWDVESGAPLARFTGHAKCIHTVISCSDGHFLSGSWDGTVRLWSSAPPKDLVKWTRENRYVRELTPDERRIYNIDASRN